MPLHSGPMFHFWRFGQQCRNGFSGRAHPPGKRQRRVSYQPGPPAQVHEHVEIIRAKGPCHERWFFQSPPIIRFPFPLRSLILPLINQRIATMNRAFGAHGLSRSAYVGRCPHADMGRAFGPQPMLAVRVGTVSTLVCMRLSKAQRGG